MADVSFKEIVAESFMSGPADLRDAGLDSDAFQETLDRVTKDGRMTEGEGYDLAHAYNHGLTEANDADDDTSNDEPLLSQRDFNDVAARGTEAKGYAERGREIIEDLLDLP